MMTEPHTYCISHFAKHFFTHFFFLSLRAFHTQQFVLHKVLCCIFCHVLLSKLKKSWLWCVLAVWTVLQMLALKISNNWTKINLSWMHLKVVWRYLAVYLSNNLQLMIFFKKGQYLSIICKVFGFYQRFCFEKFYAQNWVIFSGKL